jgi:hypothetical protein
MALRKAGKSPEQIQKDRERIAQKKLNRANEIFNKVEEYILKSEEFPLETSFDIHREFKRAAAKYSTGVLSEQGEACAILWYQLEIRYGWYALKERIKARLRSVANTHFKHLNEVPRVFKDKKNSQLPLFGQRPYQY